MDSTKSLSNWQHLEDYGIICLTGEACGYTMRILCDLTPQGKTILERFLGGNVTFREGSNWNSSRGAVASVLLPYEIFQPLAAFCLMNVDGYRMTCKLENGSVTGVVPEQLEAELRETFGSAARPWQEYISHYFGVTMRYWMSSGTAPQGDRNVHQITGRVS